MALVYILLAVSIVSAIAGYLLYVYCAQRIARRQERNLVDATDPQTNRDTRIQLNINQQILNEEEHGSEERNSESHREADVSVEYTHSASRRDAKKGKSGKKETKGGEKKGEEKKDETVEKVEKKEEKKTEKEEKKEKSESETTTTTTTTTKKESKPADPVAAADKKDAVERERVFANFMTSSDTSLKKVMFEVPPNYDESQQQQQQQKSLSSTARINTISGVESSQTNKEGSDEFQPRVVTGASGQQWLCGSPTDGVHARHPATESADSAGVAAPAATLQSTSVTMPTALLSTAKETSPRSVAGSDDGSENDLEYFTVITMSGSDTEFEQLNSY